MLSRSINIATKIELRNLILDNFNGSLRLKNDMEHKTQRVSYLLIAAALESGTAILMRRRAKSERLRTLVIDEYQGNSN